MEYNKHFEALLTENSSQDIFLSLMNNLSNGLHEYWNIAEKILQGSRVKANPPEPEYFSLEKNFFSLVFLYSFYRAGISSDRRVLYAGVNQCLRGMVTGCDNILDDEYKKTLDTTLPEKSYRFRSVLDIMISDRVLFHLLQNQAVNGEILDNTVGKAVNESLRSLLKSGAQEASEEDGVNEFLKPESVLLDVHHYKTGLLFQSPWAVPSVIEENGIRNQFDSMKKALYDIGMGCQIMDDMVDFARDISMKRHNYVASLIFHGDTKEKRMMQDKMSAGKIDENDCKFAENFPEALREAVTVSSKYLKRGVANLFKDEHMFMEDFAVNFITKQIGAETFFQ